MSTTAVAASQALFDTFVKHHVNRMGHLWSRWQDERDYEDFKGYEDEMRKLVDQYSDLEFIRATKRPFGFRAKCGLLDREVTFTVTGRQACWRIVR